MKGKADRNIRRLVSGLWTVFEICCRQNMKMNVLVINCGSSSLKYQLINSDSEAVLAKGLCERIGIDGRLVYQKTGCDKEITEAAMPTHKEAIQMVLDALTNEKTGAIKSLKEPNLVAVFIGIVLGLALGAIPFSLPGISAPVKLGLAGGPIIVGILIGTFGPRMHMVTYTTRSANLMLRALGLSLYLACLGLDAGAHFFETVFRPEGLLWIAAGFVLTVVPVLIMGVIAFKWMKVDFGSIAGMLCGSMANPMALNYANDTIPGDNPSVAYATVYPMCMFLRVIIAQVLLMFLLN